MDRLAINNPAVTVPTSQMLNGERQRKVSNPADEATKADISTSIPPSKLDVGWRRVVRNFSPSWFSVTMGTGIVATLLITIPFKANWLYYLSIVFFVLNVILFSLAFAISILRYSLYPEIWGVMIADPNNSLFLATAPMGFATIVEMWIFVCVPAWDAPWVITFAWVLWMIDSIVAAAVTTGLPFIIMSTNDYTHTLDRITAAQLLPIAATIVAAGTGSEIAEVLPNPNHAFGTLITSYIMWGMATPLAMIVIAMYFQRLALHKLPAREVIVSCFLPLGPCGFGSYTIFHLGKVSRVVFAQTDIFRNTTTAGSVAGEIAYVFGFLVALILWGFGLVWLTFALASIYKSRPFPFSMGWWGFTFPLGVFSVSTLEFGIAIPSMFFKVLGTIFSTCVVILWIVVALGTIKGAISGELFYAPCLANLKRQQREAEAEEDAEKAS
jgi:tellurite resistance protein TehA-like permease